MFDDAEPDDIVHFKAGINISLRTFCNLRRMAIKLYKADTEENIDKCISKLVEEAAIDLE